MNKRKSSTLASLSLTSCLILGSTSAIAGSLSLPAPTSDSDYYENGAPNPAKVELGKILFYDKVLSGNMNTSCATCHHSLTDTGDGLSLPIGEGASGLGVTRNTGILADAVHERVPRNAPPVFNLGAKEFSRMFHDGRVDIDPSQPTGFKSPAGASLPTGLDNVLAVQAMFPVTSGTEMAGQPGENSIADAAGSGNLAGPGGVWEQLALRLQGIPGYLDLFLAAYPGEITAASDITYVHAANAIAAFEAFRWRADNSAFDRSLTSFGELSLPQVRGRNLFYGSAGCSNCHSGIFQTDQQFHAIAMPQIGPGKGDGFDGHEDFGRERVTGNTADRYRFRTPTLRNVALTAPYGHDGAYNTLREMIIHHLDPVTGINTYDKSQTVMPSRADLDAIDFVVQDDPVRRGNIAAANELAPVDLTDTQINNLIQFLHALTDQSSIDLRADVPQSVPSGLTVVE